MSGCSSCGASCTSLFNAVDLDGDVSAKGLFVLDLLKFYPLCSLPFEKYDIMIRERHSEDYCAMYDICGERSDGKVLNCPYGSPSVKVCCGH